MGSNIDDQTIAGTNVNKNPELPPPRVVVSGAQVESGVIETPLSDNSPLPPITTKPKVRVKKSVTIREADNGFILTVFAGDFSEEWVFGRLSKAIRAIVAFLNTVTEE